MSEEKWVPTRRWGRHHQQDLWSQRFEELALIRDRIAQMHRPMFHDAVKVICRECFKAYPCPTLRVTRGELP